MSKVNVLLSTYNGSRYLREQLDSLMGQCLCDHTVVIRDDGSQDDTCLIINEYKEKYPSRIVVLDNGGRNLGYPDCFYELMEKSPAADYYSFCDQDDVWDPYKLMSAVCLLDKEDSERPCLYVHDYNVCDGKLNVLSVHTMPEMSQKKDSELIYYSFAEGFSMVINEALRKKVLSSGPKGHKMPHDLMCMWTARFLGRIVHDSRILAYYRRHEETVTTAGSNTMGKINSWIDREIKGDRTRVLSQNVVFFTKAYKDSLPEETVRKWNIIADEPRTAGGYFKRLFFGESLMPSKGGELAVRILFLLNK